MNCAAVFFFNLNALFSLSVFIVIFTLLLFFLLFSISIVKASVCMRLMFMFNRTEINIYSVFCLLILFTFILSFAVHERRIRANNREYNSQYKYAVSSMLFFYFNFYHSVKLIRNNRFFIFFHRIIILKHRNIQFYHFYHLIY